MVFALAAKIFFKTLVKLVWMCIFVWSTSLYFCADSMWKFITKIEFDNYKAFEKK